MPRRAGNRPAAYTRTRHLERFLDLVSHALPACVDEEYVRARLQLSGGDVRAFLQSLRVLGLIEASGRPTERLRLTRDRGRRSAALRVGLREAYPELVARWEREGGLARETVEDHFKLEYGLAATSAAPASKLFVDLWDAREGMAVPEAASKGGEATSPPDGEQPNGKDVDAPTHHGTPTLWERESPPSSAEGQNAVRSGRSGGAVVRIRYGADWDVSVEIDPGAEPDQIQALFEGIRHLVEARSP